MQKFDRLVGFFVRFLLSVFAFLLTLFPSRLYAATLTVGTSPGQYTTIQAALNAAATGDTIFVTIGTYSEHLTFSTVITNNVDNLALEGEETARTVIDGGGIGTVMDLSNFKNITIQNLTIKNGTTGISMNGAGVAGIINIRNNIIKGHGTTGILCTSSSNINITNNAVDGNGTGISCSSPINVIIQNNIISNNQTGASFTGFNTGSSGDFNEFFNNTPNGNGNVGGLNDVLGDPLFVEPTNNDYHLKSSSPAIDKGNPAITDLIDGTQSDIGAYGGPHMDVTPFQVQGLTVTSATTTQINLSWNANLAYDIANYKIYFDNDVSGPPYNGSQQVAMDTTNCPTAVPRICNASIMINGSPTNLQVSFGDQKLFLNWDPPSSNANLVTSYNVYFKKHTDPDTAYVVQNTGSNAISYTLTGLTNFVLYDVKVTALAPATYFINVTALDDSTPPHESDILDSDVRTVISCSTSPCESPASAVVSDMPEPIAPFPDLPDQGHCFIATAAYGSPWEPQVKILRAFRDEYLEHHDLGLRFVAWYYHTSPPWAQYLNEHSWLKPVVRVALMPAVGMAYFFVATTEIERFLILLLLVLCLMGGMFVMKKMRWCRD